MGKQVFKKRVKNMRPDEEIATVSDEALALLGLENGEARWNDVFVKSLGAIRRVAKHEEYPTSWVSTVKTKYTIPTKANTEKAGNDKCWSDAGIERFNDLRKAIIADRLKHDEFTKQWLKLERERTGAEVTEGGVEEEDPNAVDADDDFGFTKPSTAKGKISKAACTTGVADDDDDEQNDDEEDDDSDDNNGDDDDDEDSKYGQE